MNIRNIFVPVFANVDFDGPLAAAAQLANQFNAHVNVVFTRPDPVTAAAWVPEMVAASGVMLETIEAEGKTAQAQARAKFEAWRLASDLVVSDDEGSVCIAGASWYAQVGLLEKTIIEIGRVSDLIIVNYPDTYDTITNRAFTTAVFDTGRPTLLVPKTLNGDITRHVMLAWNGSLQASRAINGALPLLDEAEEVSIFTIANGEQPDSGGLGLMQHLCWHGISAEYRSRDANAGAIGTALLDAAADEDATMIVMGAYTHSRMREALLGGVTRHVIAAAALPVLMMH